jgi:ApaG protein
MKKTCPIIVTPQAHYEPEQSDPARGKFVWNYQVLIANNSEEIIQILGRWWRVTDMAGKMEEIHGVGIVGLQPIIKPHKEFSYSSYCQLMMPQGTMEGYYEAQNLFDEHFTIEIPKFILSAPSSITQGFRSLLH